MRLFPGLLYLLPAAAAVAPPAFRLPDLAKPTRYELELTIVPAQPSFQGAIRIDLDLREPIQTLWLNSRGLTIAEAHAVIGNKILPARAAASGEFLQLHWDAAPLPAGRTRIEISYRGEISDKRNAGLYRKRSGPDWYAFTTFTPIEARSAFPCFDEPAYKARWKIILHVPEDNTAASNSRMLSERPTHNGLKRVEFAETKPIPSEVVAFAVGPFDVVPDGVAGRNRVPVRILTPRGRGHEANGAKTATAQLLARLEEYTGVPYPWDKLDHVAVLDMPFGAVENPGLITYRDSTLLAKRGTEGPEHRFKMRGTMAHELAHQWFGNLVTQAWWDDVWLSEGFATWLGVKVIDKELPDFERGVQAVRERAEIMRLDSSDRTRPVRLPMNSLDDMERVYGRIVYVKGASILRMIEQWLGPDTFQSGVREYLKRHANGVATTSDFATALHTAAGVDPRPVLESHLNNAGFPSIRLDCESGRASAVGTGPWTTPVCHDSDAIQPACLLVTSHPEPVPTQGACPAWWWPNRHGAGYFVAEVAPDNLTGIVRRGWSSLSAAERLSFVEDLRLTKKPHTDAVLKILPTLATDTDPHVTTAAYRLLLALIAATPPAERQKFDEAIKQILRR